MAVVRCRCGQAIEWLRLRSGKRLPFNHPPVPVGEAPPDPWAVARRPVNGTMRTFVVPAGELGGQSRAGLRWVLVRHVCPLWNDGSGGGN